MAAEMVIWENLIIKLVSREVKLLLPLKKELDRLLVTVKTAQTGVAALDRHNLLQGNHDIVPAQRHDRSDTLKRLSTWLYDADNLLDQIVTIDQHTRLNKENEGENPSNLVQQVVHVVIRSAQEMSLFLSSSNQYGYPTVRARRQIGEMREGLKDLVRELLNQLRGNKQPEQTPSPPIESFSPIKLRLTGRDDDKKEIVKLLLQAPVKGKSNVSVICMSGLPGVGKSVLAKEIYDDHKVTTHFDLRMWIPVTGITDESEVIRQIVESCNRRSNYHNSLVPKNYADSFRDFLGCRSSGISTSSPNNGAHDNETDIYERRLRNEITGKHYLLILDDVCLQSSHKLRDLLARGARGSKILMTARTAKADILIRETAEIQAYTLHGLRKPHSLNLFKALALDHDEHCHAEMNSTGLEIAEICNHVPLTVKVAARFLHRKSRDMRLSFIEELRLCKDQGKNVMNRVLYLSYADLPTHLRACFGYCSLFPDEFTFNKHDLISRWIAQGFVNPTVDRSLEDEGEIYFIELSRRFLLEEVSTDDFGNTLTCKMHHVISNIAYKVAVGVEKLQLIDSSKLYIPGQAKHVSVNCRGGSPLKLLTPVLNNPRLRTLIFIKEPDCLTNVNTQVCHQLLSCYRSLRVLDMLDLGVKELPDSIGGQIHLRYLDLSRNDALVTLPNSITRLHNLQTLKLNFCRKLKLLDIDFRHLVNLKRFEVDGCESLSSMPLGLGKLTQLVTLSHFVVGKGSSELKALRDLEMLRGRLAIELTGNWMTNIPAEAEQVLINKKGLVEVRISWAKTPSDSQVPLKDEIKAHGEILEKLKPHENLKILRIEGYKGKDFPSWAKTDMMLSLPNLVIISIDGCSKCQSLPPFGKLEHLKKLTLRHMDNVRFIEDVTLLEPAVGGNPNSVRDRPFFKSLEELTLHNFYNLEGWREDVALATIEQTTPRSFTRLSKLKVWNCPKLTSFPSFAEVSDLNLRNVNRLLLEESEKKARKLKRKFCTKTLQIMSCLDLESFRAVRIGLGGLPSLNHLVIEDCNAIISLADEVGNIPSLERLEISSCKEVDLSDDSEAPGRGRVAFIVSSVLSSPWKNFRSLHDLKLKEIPKMKILPNGLKHVKTLKSLSLSACQSLESLPEWMDSLTALQYLRIESCRALKMLPEGLKYIKSLKKVEITECPALMERCREHKGEDWDKIKHARVLLHKSRRYGYV